MKSITTSSFRLKLNSFEHLSKTCQEDEFCSWNNLTFFFLKKGKKINLIDSDEMIEIKSSQSTLIIDKKFEDQQGGQSNILKIALNCLSIFCEISLNRHSNNFEDC